MTTDKCLTGSESVQRLRTALHAKAKEEPERRFHALVDKVWRMDFLMEAWTRVRRNGGSAGVDGETFAEIERNGVEQWFGELSRELREGTYRPRAVRQVMIPKKQPGKVRPLGIPCLRGRLAGLVFPAVTLVLPRELKQLPGVGLDPAGRAGCE